MVDGAHTKGIVFTISKSNEEGVQTHIGAWLGDLGTPIRPFRLMFECDCFLTQNVFWGSGTARHLGPTPRGRLELGRMLGCVPDLSEPSREGSASV